MNNLVVVADKPQEMLDSQVQLIAWCDARCDALTAEAVERESVAAQLTEARLDNRVARRHARLARRRVSYYDKMRQALRAGYFMIPDMDADTIAVRVKRECPVHRTHSSDWDAHHVRHQELPAGEGRYVDSEAFIADEQIEYTDKKGEPRYRREYWPVRYDESVALPVEFQKPEIVKRMGPAMRAMIFDDIAVAPRQRKRDPMVVGRIYPPGERWSPVTFLIAWFIDTARL